MRRTAGLALVVGLALGVALSTGVWAGLGGSRLSAGGSGLSAGGVDAAVGADTAPAGVDAAVEADIGAAQPAPAPRQPIQVAALFFVGETGSSWLLGAMGGTPGVCSLGFEPADVYTLRPRGLRTKAELEGAQREFARLALRPPASRADVGAWLRGMERATRAPAGSLVSGGAAADCSLFVFKARWSLVFAPALRAAPAARVVVLTRWNLVKQGLSKLRKADEDKSQFTNKGGGGGGGVLPASTVDPPRLVEHMTALRKKQTELLHELRAVGVPYLHLFYENLLAPEAGFWAQLSDFLAAPAPVRPASSGFKKATADDLCAAINNYGEVCRFLRKKGMLEPYVEDGGCTSCGSSGGG